MWKQFVSNRTNIHGCRRCDKIHSSLYGSVKYSFWIRRHHGSVHIYMFNIVRCLGKMASDRIHIQIDVLVTGYVSQVLALPMGQD